MTRSNGGRGMVAVAAFTGMLGVILGAFGAHGLEEVLVANGREDVWETAVFYHLVHAVVLLWVATAGSGLRGPFYSLFAGILIFSGTLYALALSNITILGAITPVGGLLFLVGWGWLGMRALRRGH